MVKKKIFFLLLILVHTISEPVSQTVFTKPPGITGDSKSLKILSWNIYMLPYLSLFNGNGARAKVIADKLQNSDYQIIVFQEAFSSKCRSIIAKRLKNTYPYQYGPANRHHLPLRTHSGLWIVSKIPLKELDEIKYSTSKSFDKIAHKGAVLFQGNYQGAEFQLAATHLQAENLPQIRHQQCREMKTLLNKYYHSPIPQIICGDFNTDIDDTENYQQMLQTLDAENGEISGNIKVTYDEVNNTLSQERTGRMRTIDYVLVRNSAWIEKIERKVNTYYDKVASKATNLSDHYAIEANVNFRNNEQAISENSLPVLLSIAQ